MLMSWVKRAGAPRLVLVFSGFAMDAEPVASLATGGADATETAGQGCDLAVLHSYHDLKLPAGFDRLWRDYGRIDILAWSLGVWVYSQLDLPPHPGRRLAVGGTPRPIDRELGIAPRIFRHTCQGFDAAGRERFFAGLDAPSGGCALPGRPWQDQAAELAALEQAILGRPERQAAFDLAIILGGDKIFPPASQKRYWAERVPCLRLDGGHLPATLFASLLVGGLDALAPRALGAAAPPARGAGPRLPAADVGRRFAARLDRYARVATVQAAMARGLADELAERLGCGPDRPGHSAGPRPLRLLEIGPGPGTLTREILARVPVGELHLIELFDPRPAMAEWLDREASLRQGDAETLDWPLGMDLVAAGAVVQWFRSPATLLERAWQALLPGGTLAFSGFLPGHFGEFRAASGVGLDYPSAEAWRSWAGAGAWRVQAWQTETTVLRFPSPRAVLRHIADTGVGAVCERPWTRELMSDFEAAYPRQDGACPLSYRWFRCVLRKPGGAA